ncbi:MULTISPECIES: helix-turn-helix domain-containing protein [Rhodospirillales]|uniref:Helix-turn-helix domain-containing protein n=1 Tax=Rhodocista pekingensis TaxID=201185 RepID=A0ABW2KWL7_9PROT|nr:type II toxin-antitoxin system MqsA family antitoxin [Rhodospirillum centenum]
MALVLRCVGPVSEPVTLARLLVRNGLRLTKAHEVLNSVTAGRTVAVELPRVEDAAALVDSLRGLGVAAVRRTAPPAPDVRRVRERLGLTQREFAATFGIELGTLRNWEQNRNPPDAPGRLLLRVLERHPEIVAEAAEETAADA